MGETIHIYHTNDLHSHLEHWPGIHTLMVERRKWHEEAGDEVLVFDIGDHMDRWHPLSDATRGKANCRLLHDAQYDAITIGNNEGITLPYEELDTMYEDKTFEVLVANLYKQNGSRPDWAKPYTIFRSKTGTRVGVMGLTVHFELFYKQLGWKLTNPFEELGKCLEELKGKTDVLILLSHLGIHDDERIAERFPEIDLILGGHTHHILHEGKKVGETLLAGAGKFGFYSGHVTLTLDEKTKEILRKDAKLYDMSTKSLDTASKEIVKQYQELGKSLLNTQVAILPENLEVNPFIKSKLAVMLTEAIREWCKADCAFMNAGMLLDGLQKGHVTKFDLLNICPHPINPCTVELTGAELKEVIFHSKDEAWPHMQIKGLGFRGTVMGEMVYDQIDIIDQKIYIKGKQLEARQKYILAIPDMFTFGQKFFPEIYRAPNKVYYMPEFLRDLLEWKLKHYFK